MKLSRKLIQNHKYLGSNKNYTIQVIDFLLTVTKSCFQINFGINDTRFSFNGTIKINFQVNLHKGSHSKIVKRRNERSNDGMKSKSPRINNGSFGNGPPANMAKRKTIWTAAIRTSHVPTLKNHIASFVHAY